MAFDGENDLHDFRNRTWLKPLVRPMPGRWPKAGGFPACIPLLDEDGNPLLDSNGNVICQAGTGPNAIVQRFPPALIFAPTIEGIPTDGQTLFATTGTWSNAPQLYRYQWTRNGTPISGATSNTYTLGSADLGDDIDVLVYAVNNAGVSAPAYARPVGPIPGVLTISGTPVTTMTTGEPYAGFTVSASGGWAPYTFNVVQGLLPPDIGLGGQTGIVAGICNTIYDYYDIVIQLTDRYGQTAELPPFNIEIGVSSAPRLDFSVPGNSMYYDLGVI